MADWEEQLQKVLNDPDAMGRIMQMAQQLSGAAASQPTPDTYSAQNMSAPSGSSIPDLGLDANTLARLLPLVQEWRQPNTRASQLLYALRPYLKPEKQGKVEQALRLAHLIHIGKKAVADWGGELV